MTSNIIFVELQKLLDDEVNRKLKKQVAFRSQSFRQIYDKVRECNVSNFENELIAYASKQHGMEFKSIHDKDRVWEGNLNIRQEEYGLDTTLKSFPDIMKEILLSTSATKIVEFSIRTRRACTGHCDQILYYSFIRTLEEENADFPPNWTAVEINKEKEYKEQLYLKAAQCSAARAASKFDFNHFTQQVAEFETEDQVDYKTEFAAACLPCTLQWVNDAEYFQKSDDCVVNYTNIRRTDSTTNYDSNLKSPKELMNEILGRNQKVPWKQPSILFAYLHRNANCIGEMDQVLYYSKLFETNENPTKKPKINETNLPITQQVKERRIHLAQMTLSVYEFDVDDFKQKLVLAMQNRGAELKWIQDGEFCANTSIRQPYPQSSSFFGKDDIKIKDYSLMCDEILSLNKATTYEAMFVTAQEIKGFCDQMIYFR